MDEEGDSKRLLGARIKGHRYLAGLSLEEVVRRTGIPRRTLTSYESGRREPGGVNLLKIMDALGIDRPDLAGVIRNRKMEGAR